MSNAVKIRQYFEKDAKDFDAAYSGAPNQIKDIIRRVSYIYNKKPIEGRLTALVDLVGNFPLGYKILEVGCGPGFYSIKLAQKGADVLATDYSQSMIQAAQRNAANAEAKVRFDHGDFLQMNFPETYNCTFATGVAEYVEPSRHVEFLRKMSSLASDYTIVSFPKKGILHAWVRDVWLSFSKKIKIHFFTNKEIARIASEAGLEEVERKDVGILWVIKFRRRK